MEKSKKSKLFSNKINASFLRYFLIFSLVIIVFLWLFQVVLLKQFYQYTVEVSFKNTAKSIAYNIENDNLQDLIERYAKDNNFSIRVVGIENSNLDVTVSSTPFENYLGRLTNDQINDYYEIAESNNGQKTIITHNDLIKKIEVDDNERPIDRYNPDEFLGNVPHINAQANDYMLFTQVIIFNDSTYLFIGHSLLSPVEIVSNTLLNQLMIVTVLFVLISMVFSYFISKKFAKPIAATNEIAKVLATGNYNVEFNSKGFDEINELNDTLNYAASELKKVDSLQKELVTNISHDLRTPLTMISGYAELLKEVPEERTKENLQIIIDEASRLTSLVNDVVEVNKYDENANVLDLSDFSITELIEKTLNHYGKMYKNKFIFDFEKDNDVVIKADKQKIEQVLYNLLNNAVSYSKDSNKIGVKQTIDNNKVTITIINRGDNISKEDMEFIFERYYRAKTNHVRAKCGSGLGLSIVKNIIVLHKGEVNVSSLDHINAFSFTLDINSDKN